MAKIDVVLRPEAERDIADIADYTIVQWGRSQARRYVVELRGAIERLSTTGARHPLADPQFPGMRRMRQRHHLVYYLIDGTTVDVIRVLHERMDVDAHLQ